MHPQKTGAMLGFFLLTLLDIVSFADGKAFLGDDHDGEYKHHYKQELGTQLQPFYRHQNFPPKNNLYYTPHINGQQIFFPAISGSASHADELDDYYERNKKYTQSWTLATPVTYDYDHGNQRDYEDPVTSNSMVKNLLDDTYEDGVHRGNYHILPTTRESNLNYASKQTNEDFKVKNKSSKQNLRKKDKKKKVNKDFSKLSTKNPFLVNYAAKSGVSKVSEVISKKFPDVEYAPEVVEVLNTKLSDDYAPEVAEVFDEKLPDDHAPEVVEVVNTKLSDDYAPEVAEAFDETLPDDHAPEVVEVINVKLSDEDLVPEVVEIIGSRFPDEDHAPEVVEVVNVEKHGSKKPFPSKTELLENVDDKDSDAAADKETFKSKKDKAKVTNDKAVQKPSKPEKLETSGEQSSEHIKTVKIKPDFRPATENLGEFKKVENIESSSKPNADTNKESSQKSKIESSMKLPLEDEYMTGNMHKIIKRKNVECIDDPESRLDEDGKTKSSCLETTKNLSERTLHGDESNEEQGLDSHEVLLKESFNTPEGFQAFDTENTGSGELQMENDESIRNGPQFFHNIDSIRSLSSLNANIWSLIFNPNAEFRKSKKCATRSNEPGFCMYVQHCDVPNVVTSLEQLLNDACVIDDIFIGICCPEFPVQTVKVHWEQMPSNFGERGVDEFGHNDDDCGIRSDEASKAKSWPWKAPLVSMSNGKIFCGGVVINEDYILTAAHCTTKIPKNQILVRLGQHDDSSGEDFAVVEIKRHAQYNPRTMHNDIALLKLGRRIVRDEQTDAVCLPDDDDDDDFEDDDDKEKEDDHAGEKAMLLGWQRNLSKRSVKDEILEVLTNEECEMKLGTKVPPTFLCTEARKEDERTCNADSGAPLVIKDNNRYEVIGILSWNRDDCDQKFPSTFSRVSKYVRWIKKHAV